MTYKEIYNPDIIDKMGEDGIFVPDEESMTCYKCPEAESCRFAWDPYNTDGDCLAAK